MLYAKIRLIDLHIDNYVYIYNGVQRKCFVKSHYLIILQFSYKKQEYLEYKRQCDCIVRFSYI